MKVKMIKEIPFIYGYKALDKNLCASMGNGMQFEIGRTYEAKGILESCINGFHFCKNLEDTLNYYNPSENENLRFIKIKAYGKVLSDDESLKQLCQKIKVVKELSKKEFLKALKINEDILTEEDLFNKNLRLKILLVSKGLFLGIFIKDKSSFVRAAVAEQGYGLDTLVKDENSYVRFVANKQKNAAS